MSLLKKLFGTNNLPKEPKKIIPWNRLTDVNQLNELDKESYYQPIAIFKHSTRCGISRIVLKSFENSFYDSLKNNKVYYLDLLNYRSISNEISTVFNVTHESPQLLIIKNEVALTYASHYDITTLDIDSYK